MAATAASKPTTKHANQPSTKKSATTSNLRKVIGKPKVNKKARAEIPMLPAQGLKIVKTKGRGNCLFHAVSSQIYGTDKHHALVRAKVVKFMEDHEDYFKDFVVATIGGGTRRSGRRGAQMEYSVDPEMQDKAFREYLKNMAKIGTYADQLEIVAVCGAFGYKVKVFSHMGYETENTFPGVEHVKGTILVAHHSYNHYSSVVEINPTPSSSSEEVE